MVILSSYIVRIQRSSGGDQFLRTPHLKISDLKCFISSSVEEEAVGLEGLDGCVLDFVALETGLEDLDFGGVESIRIDMSESFPSSSPSSTFRFFVGGDLTYST